ncbi:hypothetical protein ACVWXL_000068 [Bradyrhizobium sp. GM22.5]
MYADPEGYFGQASGIPYSRLHELRGRDITNFQDKIARSSVFAARESGSRQSSNGMHS